MFIPEDFKQPVMVTRYFRPMVGQPHKVRILSDKPLCGYLRWTDDKRPVRWSYMDQAPEADWAADSKPKSFIAVAVWNYDEKDVQVWEITQSSIREAIENLSVDPDFGHPVNYDLKVMRTGKDLETRYTVVPISADLKPEVQDALVNLEQRVKLENLFTGDDPFLT